MYQSILVPVDGSAFAEKALRVAQYLAGASATLYLIHVQRPLDDVGLLIGGSGLPVSEEVIQRLVSERESQARAVLEKTRSAVSLDGVEVKEIVAKGQAAEAIIEEARALGVEAIVMGSRGMSDLQGMVTGSVSHRVSHTAECTVITVH
ncbi:universal stress protein [Halomonas campisalis]|uniref:Universal stress protein n=1 Tax=Billgrantia campisalis TaxID=74661 RepID=A0ABS9P6P8_9GAMM|nr:universal stress protein [Halomonas campisalis]MCG6657455.1 universal stress protein [Halomonas campisalis]MDR5863199.1 universal stress protein [Halomonas campisalis]